MTRKVILVLDERADTKLNAIARAMSIQLGVRVDRSAAARKLIEAFSLPDRSLDCTGNSEVARSSDALDTTTVT